MTSMPHSSGGIGPIELRIYGEAWREALRFRRESSGRVPDRRPHGGSGGFAGLLRTPADIDDDTGFDESASRKGCPPSALRIAATLLLAQAFDASPNAVQDLITGGAPVVVDVADGAVLDALKGAWRGMFFDDPLRLIDLAVASPGRRGDLDGAYVMLKEPLKGAAKERLERVAADMCGYRSNIFVLIGRRSNGHRRLSLMTSLTRLLFTLSILMRSTPTCFRELSNFIGKFGCHCSAGRRSAPQAGERRLGSSASGMSSRAWLGNPLFID